MAHKGLQGPALFRRDLSFPDDGLPWRLPSYWRLSTGGIIFGGVTWLPAARYVSFEGEVNAETGEVHWVWPITNVALPNAQLHLWLWLESPLEDRTSYYEYRTDTGVQWHTNNAFPQNSNQRLGGTMQIIPNPPNSWTPQNRQLNTVYGRWSDTPGSIVT